MTRFAKAEQADGLKFTLRESPSDVPASNAWIKAAVAVLIAAQQKRQESDDSDDSEEVIPQSEVA